MAKVALNKAGRKEEEFSIWTLGMLSHTGSSQEELAFYLNIPQPSLWKRLHGQTPWKLREYYGVLEFFGEEKG